MKQSCTPVSIAQTSIALPANSLPLSKVMLSGAVRRSAIARFNAATTFEPLIEGSAQGSASSTGIGYNSYMTDKPILNFSIDPALLKRLDDFWHRHRFPNRAAAVKWLLEWSLKQNPNPR
jgi:hypothetical protein